MWERMRSKEVFIYRAAWGRRMSILEEAPSRDRIPYTATLHVPPPPVHQPSISHHSSDTPICPRTPRRHTKPTPVDDRPPRETHARPPAPHTLITPNPIDPHSASKMSSAATPAPSGTYKPLPGRVGNLTPEQQAALERLRKEVQDAGKFVPERMDDPTLLR